MKSALYTLHPDYEEGMLPPPSHHLGHLTILSMYSDACWGSQIGNSVKPSSTIPLFKSRSMRGTVVYHMSGPITWLGGRQDHTALSSCKAEIHAANEGSELMVSHLNLARDFHKLGNVCVMRPSTSLKIFDIRWRILLCRSNYNTDGPGYSGLDARWRDCKIFDIRWRKLLCSKGRLGKWEPSILLQHKGLLGKWEPSILLQPLKRQQKLHTAYKLDVKI